METGGRYPATNAGRSRRRRQLMVVAAAVLLLCTACQDWTGYMGGGALTGNDPGETIIGPANVAGLHEVFSVATPNDSLVISPPVEANGILYAGTDDGHLVASTIDRHAASCGGTPVICQPLWTASVPGSLPMTPVVADGEVIDTFEPSTGPGQLAAFDAAGSTNCSGSPKVCQPLWTASVLPGWGPNVVDGKVFVNDFAPQRLEVYDAAGVQNCTGSPAVCQPLWTAPLMARGTPSVSGGRVYEAVAGFPNGSLEVFDEAGATNCSGTPAVCSPLFTIPLLGHVDGSVSVAGEIGYVATAANLLYAFDATGATNCSGTPVVCGPLWRASLAAPEGFQVPAISGGRVYVAGENGWQAFDAQGVGSCSGSPPSCQPVMQSADFLSYHQTSPIISNGLLLVGNQIYDASGVTNCSGTSPTRCGPVWTDVAAYPTASPILADGTVFLANSAGGIDAFQP